MANWQRTLNVVVEWKQAQAREITPQQLAKAIADRLEKLKSFNIEHIDTTRDDLVGAFESLADDESATFDDFDLVWRELYDWGDTKLDSAFGGKKVCWIKTF